MIKTITIGVLIYILILCFLVQVNRRYWDNYYKIYPQDLEHSDRRQINAIEQYHAKKRARKEKRGQR